MDYVLLAFAATPVVGFLWSLKTTWVCDEKGRWICEYERIGDLKEGKVGCQYCDMYIEEVPQYNEKYTYYDMKCKHCGKKDKEVVYNPCCHDDVMD